MATLDLLPSGQLPFSVFVNFKDGERWFRRRFLGKKPSSIRYKLAAKLQHKRIKESGKKSPGAVANARKRDKFIFEISPIFNKAIKQNPKVTLAELSKILSANGYVSERSGKPYGTSSVGRWRRRYEAMIKEGLLEYPPEL